MPRDRFDARPEDRRTVKPSGESSTGGSPISSPSDIGIFELSADTTHWDAYVDGHPDGRWGHRSEMRAVMEDGLGHRPYHLEARRHGTLVGVLPLAWVRSRLFGNRLCSLPYTDSVGALANDDVVHTALTDAAIELAEDLGVGYLELRNPARRCPPWPESTLYHHYEGPVPKNLGDDLAGVPKKRRATIRKALRAGFEIVPDRTVDEFHRVYSVGVRHLGTPVLGARYFRALVAAFDSDAEIVGVAGRGRLVAAALSLYQGDTVSVVFAGSTPEGRSHGAYDLLYWRIMQRAAERGATTFDFGRSKVGTGAADFKRHWGFTPAELHYEYHLVGDTQVPELNPLNPRYARRIEAWKRTPLWVTRLVGPVLARGLG